MTRGGKLRAVVLAALMLGSVVAIPVGPGLAAAGNTAAAGNVGIGPGSVSPSDEAEGSTTVVTDTTFTVENVSKDGTNDTVYVRYPDTFTLNAADVAVENASDGSTVSTTGARVVDGPDGDSTNETVAFQVDTAGGGAVDLTVTLSTTVDLPSVDGNTDAPIAARVEDSANGTAGFSQVASLLVRNRLSVGGTVIDATGTGVGSATIEYANGTDFKNNVTDASGNYAVTPLEGLEYGVVFKQDDVSSNTDTPYPKDGVPDIYAFGPETNTANTSTADRQLPTGYRLNVTVVNGSGDPIEGATVQVSQGDYPGRVSVSNATTATGDFFASGAGEGVEVNGEVFVSVDGPGSDEYSSFYTTLDVTGDRNLTVTLYELKRVSGTVTLANGSVAKGDRIEADPEPRDVSLVVDNTTDSQGRYTVPVGKNVTTEFAYYQTAATQNGTNYPDDGNVDIYAIGTESYSDNATVDRTLPSGYDVNVTVVDESGTPIEGAEVFVSHERDGASAGADFKTNAEGLLEPQGSDGPGLELRGAVQFFVETNGAYTGNFTEINVSGDREVTVTVYEVANVSGTVTASDGTPLADSNVQANAVNIRDSDDNITDASGNYEVSLVKDKGYELTFVQGDEFDGTGFQQDGVADIYAFGTDPAPTSDATGQDLTVPTAQQLNVTVVDGTGAPVEDAEVFVGHVGNNASEYVRSFTDANGVLRNPNGTVGYELNGTVEVFAEKDGYGDDFTELTLNGTDESVTLTIRREVNVSGTVTKTDGTTPAADNEVGFIRSGGSDLVSNVTDANGKYAVRLANDTTYEVFFRQADGERDGDVDFPKDGTVDIWASATYNTSGDASAVDQRLPVGHTLNVTVVDSSGAALENATVGVAQQLDQNRVPAEGRTNADGALVLPDSDGTGIEVNGTVDVVADKPGYRINGTDVTLNKSTGDRSLTITLKQAVAVSGNVTGPDGTAATEDFLHFHGANASDFEHEITGPAGGYEVQLRPDRTYRVYYEQDDPSTDGDVAYPKDGVVDFWAVGNRSYASSTSGEDVPLPVGHQLNVTVVDAAGNPVGNATVRVRESVGPDEFGVSANTTAQGVYRHPGSDGPGLEVNGTVEVSVDKPGFAGNSTTLNVTADRDVTLTIAEQYDVRGRFVDANGAPLANDSVVGNAEVQGGENDFFVVRPSDASGNFSLTVPNSSLATEFSYFQRSDDGDFFPRDGVVDVYVFNTSVVDGPTDFGNVTVPNGYAVNVTVVDDTGAPINSSRVFLRPEQSTNSTGFILPTDEDGMAAARNASPGVELVGDVRFNVSRPPNSTAYAPENKVTNLTVTSERNVTVTVNRTQVTPRSHDFGNVVVGTTATVDVTVTNNGDRNMTINGTSLVGPDTGLYAIVAGGGGSVLEPGQSRTVTVEFAPTATGNYSTALRFENPEPARGPPLEVPLNGTGASAANVDVTVDNTTSAVLVGDTLVVDATVTNTGDVSDTQRLNLTVGGTVRDSVNVTLAGGESTAVTLSWATTSGDAGNYSAVVDSANASDSASVAVEQPPNLVATVDTTNSPVEEGQALNATATVTNTGDRSDTQTVEFSVGGTVRDSVTISLAGGESTTVALSWLTADGDAGSYSAGVVTANDTASTSVTVDQGTPANVSVALDSSNSPVTVGDTLSVTTTVTNEGTLTGTRTVNLTVDGTVRDSVDVTLAGGDSTTVTLSWATTSGDTGDYTATVDSANDTASTNVTVQDPPNVAVTVDGTTSPVTEGSTLDVTTTVENTGDATDTQTIELVVDGGVQDSVTVTLAGNESRTVTLSWATTTGDAGDYSPAVRSANDSASASVTVEAAATSTPTPTDTSTAPTSTATSTATATPAPNNTSTPTPTATATDVPTDTDTPTDTATPTDSPTPTDTDTPTDTGTAADTATGTTTDAADTEESPTATTTGAPGFGPLAALAALLSALVALRRRG
jgi:PGF-CTERM protein